MPFRRIISFWIVVSFFLTSLGPLPQAHGSTALTTGADSVLGLPTPGTMINLSSAYEPVIIKGLTVHKDNPFLFDFIVDVGQDKMSGEPLKKEGEKLIKYFLASLAIPDKDVWVNLSPYEKNRMIPEVLGQTDMGRDLLEQDYILKQITASLIYPEKQLGKTFWDKVYAKAQEMYGTTQVPVNTFNKIWIMADRAEVFEHNQTAFVVDCHLKVMLEEDYLALEKNHGQPGGSSDRQNCRQAVCQANERMNVKAPQGNNPHALASQIVKEIILPQLEKEVNTGKNFANLRQIFNSIILSSWYKKNLKEALLNQVYANKSKIKGIERPGVSAGSSSGVIASEAKQSQQDLSPEQIYEQYLKAYKKGVFNYIKEDINTLSGETIPRKYFSGGMDEGMAAPDKLTVTTNPGVLDAAMGSESEDGRLVELDAAMTHNSTDGAMMKNVSKDMAMRARFSPDQIAAVDALLEQSIRNSKFAVEPYSYQFGSNDAKSIVAFLGRSLSARLRAINIDLDERTFSHAASIAWNYLKNGFDFELEKVDKQRLEVFPSELLLPDEYYSVRWVLENMNARYGRDQQEAARILDTSKDPKLDYVREMIKEIQDTVDSGRQGFFDSVRDDFNGHIAVFGIKGVQFNKAKAYLNKKIDSFLHEPIPNRVALEMWEIHKGVGTPIIIYERPDFRLTTSKALINFSITSPERITVKDRNAAMTAATQDKRIINRVTLFWLQEHGVTNLNPDDPKRVFLKRFLSGQEDPQATLAFLIPFFDIPQKAMRISLTAAWISAKYDLYDNARKGVEYSLSNNKDAKEKGAQMVEQGTVGRRLDESMPRILEETQRVYKEMWPNAAMSTEEVIAELKELDHYSSLFFDEHIANVVRDYLNGKIDKETAVKQIGYPDKSFIEDLLNLARSWKDGKPYINKKFSLNSVDKEKPDTAMLTGIRNTLHAGYARLQAIRASGSASPIPEATVNLVAKKPEIATQVSILEEILSNLSNRQIPPPQVGQRTVRKVLEYSEDKYKNSLMSWAINYMRGLFETHHLPYEVTMGGFQGDVGLWASNGKNINEFDLDPLVTLIRGDLEAKRGALVNPEADAAISGINDSVGMEADVKTSATDVSEGVNRKGHDFVQLTVTPERIGGLNKILVFTQGGTISASLESLRPQIEGQGFEIIPIDVENGDEEALKIVDEHRDTIACMIGPYSKRAQSFVSKVGNISPVILQTFQAMGSNADRRILENLKSSRLRQIRLVAGVDGSPNFIINRMNNLLRIWWKQDRILFVNAQHTPELIDRLRSRHLWVRSTSNYQDAVKIARNYKDRIAAVYVPYDDQVFEFIEQLGDRFRFYVQTLQDFGSPLAKEILRKTIEFGKQYPDIQMTLIDGQVPHENYFLNDIDKYLKRRDRAMMSPGAQRLIDIIDEAGLVKDGIGTTDQEKIFKFYTLNQQKLIDSIAGMKEILNDDTRKIAPYRIVIALVVPYLPDELWGHFIDLFIRKITPDTDDPNRRVKIACVASLVRIGDGDTTLRPKIQRAFTTLRKFLSSFGIFVSRDLERWRHLNNETIHNDAAKVGNPTDAAMKVGVVTIEKDLDKFNENLWVLSLTTEAVNKLGRRQEERIRQEQEIIKRKTILRYKESGAFQLPKGLDEKDEKTRITQALILHYRARAGEAFSNIHGDTESRSFASRSFNAITSPVIIYVPELNQAKRERLESAINETLDRLYVNITKSLLLRWEELEPMNLPELKVELKDLSKLHEADAAMTAKEKKIDKVIIPEVLTRFGLQEGKTAAIRWVLTGLIDNRFDFRQLMTDLPDKKVDDIFNYLLQIRDAAMTGKNKPTRRAVVLHGLGVLVAVAGAMAGDLLNKGSKTPSLYLKQWDPITPEGGNQALVPILVQEKTNVGNLMDYFKNRGIQYMLLILAGETYSMRDRDLHDDWDYIPIPPSTLVTIKFPIFIGYPYEPIIKAIINPAMLSAADIGISKRTDAASLVYKPGGIDLNTSNGMQWKVSKDGKGVEMNVDPAAIERIKREGIDSLSPVIFRITPVTSIWPLVGLQAPVPAEHSAGA